MSQDSMGRAILYFEECLRRSSVTQQARHLGGDGLSRLVPSAPWNSLTCVVFRKL